MTTIRPVGYKETVAHPPHNLHDYFIYVRGQWNRVVLRLLYGSQVQDGGIRQLYRLPLLRFRNGRVFFGRGTILRGRLTVVFGGVVPGQLRLGDSFVGDGDISLNPRGGNIEIGSRCFVGAGSLLQAYMGTSINIGDDVMVAHGVTIVASNHGTHAGIPINLQPEYGKGITIGNDVWIAANVVILDGVTIENGAVVAAGAVVSKDVARNVVVGGIPARPLGMRKLSDPQL